MTPAPSTTQRPGRRGVVVFLAVCIVLAIVASLVAAVIRGQDDTVLTVNGWTLTRSEFSGQLDQIAGNPLYVAARSQGGRQLKVFRDGSTTEFDSSFVVEFLNERVTFVLVEAEVARRGLVVTAEDREQAEATIEANLAIGSTATTETAGAGATTPPTSLPGASVLAAFGSYRDVLVGGVTNLQVLQRDLVKGKVGDDALRSLYDQAGDAYSNQACVRDLQINATRRAGADGNPATPTEAEMAAALERITQYKAQLDAGADFAALAQQVTDDPITKDKGGDLGCAPRATYARAIDDAVWAQPVGVVGGPIRSDNGYHLILVTERRTFSFDELKAGLRRALDTQAQQELQNWTTDAAKKATVVVDPGAGSWNATTGVIEPPSAADLGLVPDTGATSTVPASTVPPGPGTTGG